MPTMLPTEITVHFHSSILSADARSGMVVINTNDPDRIPKAMMNVL